MRLQRTDLLGCHRFNRPDDLADRLVDFKICLHVRFLLKHGKQERFPSYSAIFRRNAARAAFLEDLRPSGHGTPHTLPGGAAVGRKDRKQFFFISYFYPVRMDSSTEKIYAFTGIIAFSLISTVFMIRFS